MKMKNNIRSEDAATYTLSDQDDAVILQALEILERRHQRGSAMTSPSTVKRYLTLRASKHDREVFSVLFLDSQNRILTYEEMFLGTISQASVYPREVARRALMLNAAAVIVTHNHPSGNTQPSRADEELTKTLKSALALVDVRLLDHIITAAGQSTSMAEMGLV